MKLATSIADLKVTAAERRSRALLLERDIDRFMDGPRPRYQSRLEPLHDVVDDPGSGLGQAATDPDTLGALAQALKVTHTAIARTAQARRDRRGPGVRRWRGNDDPAANLNAQSIVIHPLHRPGAPGIDQRSHDDRPRQPSDRTPTAAQLRSTGE